MAVLAVIPYDGPAIRVRVTFPVSNWCPVSHEPQPGSTITLSYMPSDCLIDVADLAWLRPDADWPRDLEAVVAYLKAQAEAALGVPVSVAASFLLANGVVLECQI